VTVWSLYVWLGAAPSYEMERRPSEGVPDA